MATVVRSDSGEKGPNDGLSLSNLPPAVLQRASSQVRWIALVCAATTVVIMVLQYALQPEVTKLTQTSLIVNALVAFCSSIFLVAARHFDWLSATTIARLGLAYEILVGFNIAFAEYSIPWDTTQPVRGVSWIAPWLSLCTLLIPNRPVNLLLAAIATASMEPLGYLAAHTCFRTPPFPMNRLLICTAPAFVVALGTVFLNRKLFRLELEVNRVKAMGSYQLDALLGKGGMGEVWRARHRMLARDAAIKLIQPEMLVRASRKQAAVMRRRFGQEAETTAALRSPHTVELYDFGVSEDGRFYYVMELLDGLNLETLVNQFGPVPPGRVVHILRQVCESLGEAHQLGLIHRDIKPANIFLCRMGLQYDFSKVLDFGLVKAAADDSVERITTAGVAKGTPAYMAPELITTNRELDGRADLYCLGCVAYWLLTGNLVFNEKSAMATMMAHMRDAPIPPSGKSELPIPASLDRLVMRCLAKKPEDRPASAQALAQMLDDCKEAGPWTQKDAEQWWRTNRPETLFKRTNSLSPADLSTATMPPV